MLNDNQEDEYTRDLKLQAFFAIEGNTTIINTYLPFKNQRTSFNNHVLTMEGYMPQKDASGKPITETKEEVKINASTLWAPILAKTLGYANHINDNTLQAAVHFTEAQILAINDGNFLQFATNLNTNVFTETLMTNEEFITYEVTADEISAALARSTTFNGMIGQADNVDSTSTIASDNIDATIKLTHIDIDQLTLFVQHFKITQPDFYAGFFINSHKVESHHHQGIQGIVTKDGEPTKDAVISILDTTKSTTPDFEGHYSLIKVKNGNRQAKCTTPGKPDQIKTIYIRKGHIEKLNFDF